MTVKKNSSLSPKARARSIAIGAKGIALLVASQKNAWIHLAATVAVVAAGVYFGLAAVEWGLLVLAIMAVWAAEGFNTAMELLADAISPEYHPLVGKAKDVAAGAVLITAIGSVAIGLLVFGPHVLEVFRR